MARRALTTSTGRRGRSRGLGSRSVWHEVAVGVAAGIAIMAWPQELAQAQGDVRHKLELAQGGGAQAPRIAVLSTVVAEPASQMPLQIRIAPADAIPKNSFVRLRGLPPTASLSEGHSISPGAWAVPLNGLPRLTLNLPASASGKSELLINLVNEDGQLLAEARVSLVIQPSEPAPAPPGASVPPPPRAQAPVLMPADRENAEKLIARGERDLDLGNIAQARQFFLRAAQIGLARGALMMASTYDPRELARMHAVSVQPNIAEARRWYVRAGELGAPEAAQKLATLGGD